VGYGVARPAAGSAACPGTLSPYGCKFNRITKPEYVLPCLARTERDALRVEPAQKENNCIVTSPACRLGPDSHAQHPSLADAREKLEGGRRFVCNRSSSPRATSPPRSPSLPRPRPGGERNQVLLGATGTGKTFTMAEDHRGDPAPGDHPRPEQDARGTALRRVQGLLPGQRGRVLRPITTTISPRPTCPAPTPSSRRNPRSTSRSTGCATPPPGRCSSATTSSSSPRCPASTASARSRPTAR
jgi:hypothetical protein